MLEKGKTYKFTSRKGVSKEFTVVSVITGSHGWHGPYSYAQIEYYSPAYKHNIYARVNSRLGELYVRCKDDPHSRRYTSYWRPV